jgi:hypothetical protein
MPSAIVTDTASARGLSRKKASVGSRRTIAAPSGQPMTTPRSGTPPKNRLRFQSGQRRIAGGPPTSLPRPSNIAWISAAIVMQTTKLRPYHSSQMSARPSPGPR